MKILKENFIFWNLSGIAGIIYELGMYLFRRYNLASIWEKIFLPTPLFLWFLLMQQWRGYRIHMDNLSDYHGIYTDDLLIFFLLIGLLFLSALYTFLFQPVSEKAAKNIKRLRIVIAAIILFGFLITLIFPERVAPVKEASFTMWFYLFGLFSVLAAVSGVLGINTTPRTDEEFQ